MSSNEYKKCRKCGDRFIPIRIGRKGSLINYCSLKCRNSHSRSDESKKKTSETLRDFYLSDAGRLVAEKVRLKNIQSWRSGKRKVSDRRILNRKIRSSGKKILICSYCKSEFTLPINRAGRYRTWCSDKCFSDIKRHNAKGIKRKEYNGQIFDSGFEVKVAMFLDKHNIKWSKCTDAIQWVDKNGKVRRYFPDFYLADLDLYLDPKNKFCIEQQKEKLDIVKHQINLIYGDPVYITQYLRSVIGNIPEYESGDFSVRS